jgi:hypothetical protein
LDFSYFCKNTATKGRRKTKEGKKQLQKVAEMYIGYCPLKGTANRATDHKAEEAEA